MRNLNKKTVPYDWLFNKKHSGASRGRAGVDRVIIGEGRSVDLDYQIVADAPEAGGILNFQHLVAVGGVGDGVGIGRLVGQDFGLA